MDLSQIILCSGLQFKVKLNAEFGAKNELESTIIEDTNGVNNTKAKDTS